MWIFLAVKIFNFPTKSYYIVYITILSVEIDLSLSLNYLRYCDYFPKYYRKNMVKMNTNAHAV